jgi:HK97 family phage prohead protease
MIYAFKTLDLEVKDVDRKQGIVSGYFSAFGVKDADGDIIHPGAFSRSITEWGPGGKGRIKHLMNHDPSKPLGKILELKEDDYGLFYKSKIGTHNLGMDFLKMVESELIREHSIGFSDLTPMDRKQGEDHNNITDLKLYEGSSLTAWGANEFTPLTEVKGLTIESISERIEKFERFVRSTDATDETIELCLLNIKQLGQLIESMTSSRSAAEAVDQRKAEEEAKAIQIQTIKNAFSQWKTLNK